GLGLCGVWLRRAAPVAGGTAAEQERAVRRAERSQRTGRAGQRGATDAGQPPPLSTGSGRDGLVPDRLVDLALALRALSRSTEERGAQAIRDVGAVLRPVVRSRARLHRAARRRRLPLARRPGAYPVASPHPFSDPSPSAARRLSALSAIARS